MGGLFFHLRVGETPMFKFGKILPVRLANTAELSVLLKFN